MDAHTAVFTFLGVCLEEEFHVLVTDDAAPSDFGSLPVLGQAREHATTPYAADEFAANFVARAFPRASIMRGTVRLLPSGDWEDVAPAETRYRYAVSCGKAKNAGKLMVVIYGVSPVEPDRREWHQRKLAEGTLDDMLLWAEKERESKPASSTTRVRTRTRPIGAPHAGR